MKNTPLTLLLAAAVLLAGCAPGVQAAPASDPKSACPTNPPRAASTALLRDCASSSAMMACGTGFRPAGTVAMGKRSFGNSRATAGPKTRPPTWTSSANNLDGEGYFEQTKPATNAYSPDLLGSAILTGVEFPQAGCWQITGHYRDSQLSFVVWVGE